MPVPIPIVPQRLLDLFDEHNNLLAELDFFPEQQMLWVRWFGHLTEASVVQGTLEAVALRTNGLAPRRLLSDETHATGEWHEAMAWMQYDWLPNAVTHGLRAMAFVPSASPTNPPDYLSFLVKARASIAYEVFPTPQSAWHWLARQN